ncbi:hypothetical protein QTP70_026991, partial [Hemibagrus guttatus]
MPHREEAPGKTQDTLERLCLSAGLGTPRGPSGRVGGSVWGEGAPEVHGRLIQDGDESAYRQEVEQLAAWCSLNNLELNTLKTVEMIVDFSRNTPALPPLTIMNSTVPTVESFRFLGTTISQDLKWDAHIDSIIKKAQQRLYFLQQLRKFNLPQELLTQFYSAVCSVH